MKTTTKPGEFVRTRNIEARLSDEDLQRLEERALHMGVDCAEWVGFLIRKGLEAPPSETMQPHEILPPRKSLAEIFAPVHREFADSGMTEEQLYEFLEEAREEAWREKQRAKGQQ